MASFSTHLMSFTGGSPLSPHLQDLFKSQDYQMQFKDFRGDRFLEEVKNFNIISRLPSSWPIRNQLSRGTCTAFAVAACIEAMEAIQTNSMMQLSPEFLYWHMRFDRDESSDSTIIDYDKGATKIGWASGVLSQHGIASEPDMEYITEPNLLSNELISLKGPGKNASTNALLRLYESDDYEDFYNNGSAGKNVTVKIQSALSEGRPVAIALPFLDLKDSPDTNWTVRAAISSGIVHSPFLWPNHFEVSGVSSHAVCIVDYKPPQSEDDPGWFIFKNSWGGYFGRQPGRGFPPYPTVPDVGFGAVSAGFVEGYTVEFASFKRMPTFE